MATDLDRFSELPDQIIHHIMFFLPITDATRASALSRRFRSAWSAFPVIDIKEEFFAKSNRSYYGNTLNLLLGTAESALTRLRARNTSVNKFRLDLVSIHQRTRVCKVIDSAIESKVEELDVNFCGYLMRPVEDIALLYPFPSGKHALKSIKVLKLSGFEIPNSILSFPCLEFLRLSVCLVAEKLRISGPRLRILKLKHCYGCSEIKIQASSLEYISFQTTTASNKILSPSQPPPGCMDLSVCKSIKTLKLETDLVSEEWIADNLSIFPLLEELRLRKCGLLRNLSVTNASLGSFVLDKCNFLEKISIAAESLDSFVYKGTKDRPCAIDIKSARFLRNLEIHDGSMTEEWVERILTNFCFLESVNFSGCKLLQKFKISSENLRVLQLHECRGLKEAEINACNLRSFTYHGDTFLPFLFIVDSWNLEAKLSLNKFRFPITSVWYTALRDFLVCFGHCKLLTLACNSAEVLIFPEELRENMVPPLFDIKHVKVETNSQFDARLVDSLLWFCPHPLSVTITSSSADGSEGKEEKILEFTYDKTHASRGEFCCLDLPVKCWKHYLKEVRMQNFDKNECRIMKQFFENSLKRWTSCDGRILGTIYINNTKEAHSNGMHRTLIWNSKLEL